MLVVLFHAYPTLVPNGYLGVDIFFVISGYVISRAYLFPILERRARPDWISIRPASAARHRRCS